MAKALTLSAIVVYVALTSIAAAVWKRRGEPSYWVRVRGDSVRARTYLLLLIFISEAWILGFVGLMYLYLRTTRPHDPYIGIAALIAALLLMTIVTPVGVLALVINRRERRERPVQS